MTRKVEPPYGTTDFSHYIIHELRQLCLMQEQNQIDILLYFMEISVNFKQHVMLIRKISYAGIHYCCLFRCRCGFVGVVGFVVSSLFVVLWCRCGIVVVVVLWLSLWYCVVSLLFVWLLFVLLLLCCCLFAVVSLLFIVVVLLLFCSGFVVSLSLCHCFIVVVSLVIVVS